MRRYLRVKKIPVAVPTAERPLGERVRAREACEKIYRAAKRAERAGDEAHLRTLLAKALRRDERASPADWQLLERIPLQFQERREIQQLIGLRLATLRKAARDAQSRNSGVGTAAPRVFIYLGQGFSAAPPIVQACQKEVWRFHGPDDVVLLDDSNLHEWVSIPENLELIR